MVRTHEVLKSFSPKSYQSTNAMEGYERKNQEEIHKELQDLAPIGSPHIEEIMMGGKVDLDLLSLFPQKDARIMGGMGRKGKLFKVNNGGERKRRANLQMRKKGLYIAPAQNLTVIGILTQKFWPQGQNFRPGGEISALP
jgi:hypothetical protein